MRKSNRLKRDLSEGKTVLGTWSVLPSGSVANVLGASGLDFVIIDMEHGSAGFETVEEMCRALESEGCTPLARVPENNESYILRALDVGVHGVVIPQIEDVRAAKQAASAVKYAPLGSRGFSPFTRTGGYSKENLDKRTEIENKETMTILIVEGVQGIKNLDAILEVPGIDVIYIGTFDLSQSVGLSGQVQHKKVLDLLEGCVKKIIKKGLFAGCLATGFDEARRWKEMGITFIPYLVDCTVFRHAFNEFVEKVKR